MSDALSMLVATPILIICFLKVQETLNASRQHQRHRVYRKRILPPWL